jgi:ATP-binding cassette subfamily F protein 3
VDPDYFAQDQYKELDPEARVLDDLGNFSTASTQTELRSLLGCFLFSADDVFKRIGVLSGGERNRYALLRLLLHPANFLLLDEPTNHLDMRAKDVLLNALMEYNGTVVFVSHDRYFIDRLATRVFEVGEGQVRIYPGNYEDYLWRKQNQASADTPAPGTFPMAAVPSNGDGAAADAKSKRLNPIKRRQIEKRCQELEKQISQLEAAIAQCETALQSFVSADETQRLHGELQQHRAGLESRVAEWGELSQALE